MKSISLTQDQVALVDDEDFDHLNQWRWFASWSEEAKTFYAIRQEGRPRRNIHMSREILNPEPGLFVDHVNHNGLDNRKENLRCCTHASNMMNKVIYANNKSGYKGVMWRQGRGKWLSGIRVSGRWIYLGLFEDRIDAAKAYDAGARKHFGEFALLNFPGNTREEA